MSFYLSSEPSCTVTTTAVLLVPAPPHLLPFLPPCPLIPYLCRLLELSRSEGADLFHSYCTEERRNYVEVLEDFSSVDIPLSALIDLLPPLLPRHYSIAGSCMERPQTVELCIALVQYRTRYGRSIEGVCSSWLQTLQVGVSAC